MNPPRVSEWLLLRSHPPAEREAVAGDLAEELAAIAASRGPRAARQWYRRQMLGSLLPNARRRFQSGGSTDLPVSLGDSAMRSLVSDVRFTLRLSARRPLVTLVALGSLVIGVSLATVLFSLLNALVLRPLPAEDSDRLALLVERRTTGTAYNFSYPLFLDLRGAQQAFTDLAAWSNVVATHRETGGARPLAGELVSGTFFDLLGVRMRMGRAVSAADDARGARPVVVVDAALWQRLGGGATLDARSLLLNDTAFDVVGVVDRSFTGMEIGRRAQFWAPMAHQASLEPGRDLLGERRSSWALVIGRLRDGVTVPQAEADLARVEASLRSVQSHRPVTLALEPDFHGRSYLSARAGGTLTLLLGASVMVLLIVSANLANLMLAGAADRRREFAIRAALGAGRLRLARLVVVETALLGLVAAAGAALVANWAGGLVLPLIRAYGEPVWLDLTLDARTLGFAATVACGAALLGGVVPILQVVRAAARGRSLADGGRTASDGPAGGRFRAALLVTQFALSLALVVVSGLFVRTVVNLLGTPTGYDIDRIALLSVDPTTVNPKADAIRQYLDAAVARLGTVPGVRAVGFARVTPVGFGGSRMTIAVPGYDPRPDEDMELNYNTISEGYFAATGIPLRAGRELTSADRSGRPLVAVINETMAQRFWAGRSPVGQFFAVGEQPVEVVGVVPDTKYRMVREAPRPSFYMSVRQLVPRAGVFHVRTHDDPAALLPTLRQALTEVDPRIPIADARTLRQQVRYNVNDERLTMWIGATLGGTALLLAAAGLFASMWYAVGRRTREIGVRMALGADAGAVSRSVVRQSLRLVLTGSALGAGLAFWLGRLVESRLYRVSPADPVSFMAAALVLGAAALVASWAPARRAARVDPVIALRVD